MTTTSNTSLDRLYKRLVIFSLVIAVLILTRDIVMPLAFAALFSMILLPITNRLEKKTGRIFAISIVLLSTLFLVMLLSWFIVNQITGLVQGLPDLEKHFFDLINNVSFKLNDTFKISTIEQAQILKDSLKSVSSYLGELLFSTSYLAYFLVQVPIYIFLFLMYRDRFTEFLLKLKPNSELKWKDEIQSVVRSYISGLMLVVLIAAILNSIGMLVLGIEHAIFFGFLSGMLTMIPYIGITIGALLPTLIALITKDSIWYAVGVVGVHATVQFLEGNFITPKITGSKISVNALAAIIALLVGGKIWGIPGMILAVPALGVLKIIFSYSPAFRPFVILLDDKHTDSE